MHRGHWAGTEFRWFDELNIEDRIALLRDPHQQLSGELADHAVARNRHRSLIDGKVRRRATSNGDGCRGWRLTETAAEQLCDARKKLDIWWDSESLTPHEQELMIRHRWDDELPAHAVMVDLVLLRTYLEMKARRHRRFGGAAACDVT